jgi:hypothetical protein
LPAAGGRTREVTAPDAGRKTARPPGPGSLAGTPAERQLPGTMGAADPPPGDDLFESLERRAFEELPDEDEEPLDLLAAAGAAPADEALRDLTLGGYIDKHSRVPAFEGSDAQPYTVDVATEQEEEGDEYVAFLIFVRWAGTGAGIMDHLESGDVARGATEAEARRAAMELSLFEVKAELDRAIERRRLALEG